jgi:hypothetical protein
MASDRPLTRICVRVFKADYDKACDVAAARGVPVNEIIRQALHTVILHLNDLERKALDTTERPRLVDAAQ